MSSTAAAAAGGRERPTAPRGNTSRRGLPCDGGLKSEWARSERSSSSIGDEEEMHLKYGAKHVISLFVPITVCMIFVVLVIRSVTFYSDHSEGYMLYTPFTENTTSNGELLLHTLGNASITLSVFIVMTIVLIVLYKCRCYKIIHFWMVLSSLMLLSIFLSIFVKELIRTMEVNPSLPTVAFGIWNVGLLGMIAIHWKAPLLLQQAYHVLIAGLMALVLLKYLPNWTVWMVLFFISIWDLVAVLCPLGPLRVLVETAQQRGEPIFPALIYTAGVAYVVTMATGDNTTASSIVGGQSSQETERAAQKPGKVRRVKIPPSAAAAAADQSDRIELRPMGEQNRHAANNRPPSVAELVHPDDQHGVRLGLGDFIFYSVLIGKAATYGDCTLVISCYLAILVGLAVTLALLAFYRRALPALPFSIFAGLIFFFAAKFLISPFTLNLATRQVVY